MTEFTDPISAFRDAMASHGITLRDQIIADGALHRAYVEGDRRGSKNAWYKLVCDDRPAGMFGDVKRLGSTKISWKQTGFAPMTQDERAALRVKMREAAAERESREREIHAAAAILANQIWDGAKDATVEHPYLKRKKIGGAGLKVGDWVKEWINPVTGEVLNVRVGNALLIPLRNSKRQIVSLQAIFPSDKNKLKRDKDFITGGEKAGCFFTIGKPVIGADERPTVIICEGYATGESIGAATGHAVLVAFDAGNLLPVAKMARRLMPTANIVIAADNDQWTDKPIKNPGVTFARRAADAVGARVSVPIFADLENKPTDFNDLRNMSGDDVVKGIMGFVAGTVAVPESVSELCIPTLDSHLPDEPPPHDDAGETILLEPLPAEPEKKKRKPRTPRAPVTQGDEIEPHNSAGYFQILGHDEEKIYVYSRERKTIVSRGDASWKGALTTIAPLSWWERHFKGTASAGGMNESMAVNWLQRRAYEKGYYDHDSSRGLGAWVDEGRFIYHLGNELTVDGEMSDLGGLETEFVYERRRGLPSIDVTPLTDAEGRGLIEVAKMFRWAQSSSGILIAGWCALAPLGGALDWRPHTWLTGGTGSGKSTIMKDFVNPLMAGVALPCEGLTTEAGIRQKLRSDALPVLFEESEKHSEREALRVDGVLALARNASTENGAKTYKGSANGSAVGFQIRSMFCIASVAVGINHQADFERISILSLRPKHEREADGTDAADNWKRIKDRLYELRADKTLSQRLMRRSIDLLPITLQNIVTFAHAGAKKFGSQREGDQYGALLAGAWSLVSQKLATPEQAAAMFDRYDWQTYLGNSEDSDSNKALDAVLQTKIRINGGSELNVLELVERAAGLQCQSTSISQTDAEDVLHRYGMAVRRVKGSDDPMAAEFFVAITPQELLKLLRSTPFQNGLKGQLMNSKGAREDKTKLGRKSVRGVFIPLVTFIEAESDDASDGYRPGYDDEMPF